MKKLQTIKIALLIVILAEEIKRATKKQKFPKFIVHIDSKKVISELVQKISELKSVK